MADDNMARGNKYNNVTIFQYILHFIYIKKIGAAILKLYCITYNESVV